MPVSLFCRRCLVGRMETKLLPGLGVLREVRSRAGTELGCRPQAEESEHPRGLASSGCVAKSRPGCFEPSPRSAGFPPLPSKRNPPLFRQLAWGGAHREFPEGAQRCWFPYPMSGEMTRAARGPTSSYEPGSSHSAPVLGKCRLEQC